MPGTAVAVENGNVDKAIRKLKKKLSLSYQKSLGDPFKSEMIGYLTIRIPHIFEQGRPSHPLS